MAGLTIGCSSAHRTFKNYYDALVSKKPAQAATYLSDPCKNKLVKLKPDLAVDQVVQETLMPNFKSYEIGKHYRIGDTLLFDVKIAAKDGTVYNFHQDVDSVALVGGKMPPQDFRYRLYKEGGQWKIDTPYCRNFR
ncbi:hypothetical protein [Spirosoma sp. KNUC1025]|uniref:hypothetical protein n=1 Tax=Spirosoma sp. KNUC1025 TaxID=2894082 RepID=UPI00386C69A5|nr:hypothetical protein LN737_00160 [Spirosoma sp. KNUC1025]